MIRGESETNRVWGRATARVLGVAFASAVVAAALVDCGGSATCQGVCDNVIDKCLQQPDSVAYNNCLEDCSQRVKAVPEKCNDSRDEVLSCLSSADSINCLDAQQSAACADENAALVVCALGGSNSNDSNNAGGTHCLDDDECANGKCNSKLQQCADPQQLGGPCYDDDECANGRCNSKLQQCADPQSLGGPCYDDDECANGKCNSKLQECANAGPTGTPCYDDDECTSGTCSGANTCI